VLPDPALFTRARPALWVAAGVLLLEALAVAGYAVLYVLSISNVAAGVGYGVAAMLFGWAVALVLIARGVARGRGWSRAPAVALQLLQLPLALGFRDTIGLLAFVLFITAATVLVCLFLPTSNEVFVTGRRLPGEPPPGGAAPGPDERRSDDRRPEPGPRPPGRR
jgi:hypothetical protein